MTFLEFFIYSTLSNILYTIGYVGFVYIKAKYLEYKVQRMIKSGEIQVMNLDDLENQLDIGAKKTWN